MAKQSILDSPEVAKLERLIEEATRSTEEGVRRFVEPASGTIDRAVSRQHHLVFGRRGSGKSSLLRKAAADLTVDRRPMAFVDLETFKGHSYPDVLLSVLVKTFSEFAEWLETAAIAPASKTSYWSRVFGAKPTRPAFDKSQARVLANDLRKAVEDLRELLFAEDDVQVETTQSATTSSQDRSAGEASIALHGAKLGMTAATSGSVEDGQETSKKFTTNKLNHLHRHILEYQALFRRMSVLSGGDAFLFLDDLYHIRRRDQAQVIDYFHRIGVTLQPSEVGVG